MKTSTRSILFLVALAGAARLAKGGGPSSFETGTSYKYAYEGQVTSSTKNFPAGMKIKAVVNFEFQGRQNDVDTVLMKLVPPTLIRDLRGNALTETDLDEWEEPILFERSVDGSIGTVLTSLDHPTDVLNVKRGIASLLQAATATTQRAKTTFTKNETDLGGTCQYVYTAERMADGRLRTRKVNNFKRCSNRAENFYSPVELLSCDADVKVNPHRNINFPKSFTETNCTMNSAFVQSCNSTEKHEIDTGSGSLEIKISRKLTFQGEFFNPQPYPLLHELTSDRKGLVFEFNNLYSGEKKGQIIYTKVYRLLEDLSRTSSMNSTNPELFNSDTPVQLIELVNTFRWINNLDEFRWIYDTLYQFSDQYRLWLKGALPFIGNEHAMEIIREKIESKDIVGYGIVQLLSRVGVTPRSNEGMCDKVKDICNLPPVRNDANAYSTCWLAFGSLVYTMYQGGPSIPQRYVAALQSQYDRFAGGKDMEKFVVTLKTIGNTGMKTFFTPILKVLDERDRIEPPHPSVVVVSAIDALRRMRLNVTEKTKMQNTLREVFADTKACPEMRTNAFARLMKTHPSTPQLGAIANIIAKEPKLHVRNYVFTYLSNMVSITCPLQEAVQARKILGILANQGKAGFTPSFTRAMHFKTQAINPMYMREDLEVHLGYSPLSFIPRYFNIKTSMKLLEYKFDVMEFYFRQEGLLPFLKEMFGPYGSAYSKKSIWDYFRPKRSDSSGSTSEELKKIVDKLNVSPRKDKPLRLDMSSKLFGSEVEYLVIDENHQMLKSLSEDGTIRIDKNWLENQLSVGMKQTKRSVDILFDGMRMIPTSMGLPLKWKLSAAGVIEVVVEQQLSTKPLFNLLSWNNKPTKIEGSLTIRPRCGVSAKAEIHMFYRESKFGFTYQRNNSMYFPLDFDFNYDQEKRKYTKILKMPNQKKTLMKTSSAAFMEISTKRIRRELKYIPAHQQTMNRKFGQSNQAGKPVQTRGQTRQTVGATGKTGPTGQAGGPAGFPSFWPNKFGPVQRKNSPAGALIQTTEVRSIPTRNTGYGLKFEIENGTSGVVEQLYKLKVTRLGTKPLDYYTAEIQFKIPPTRPPRGVPNQPEKPVKPTNPVRPDGKSSKKPELPIIDIAKITLAHSMSEWKMCYAQKMNLAQKKSIVNIKWGKQCKGYELNATAGMTRENGNPAFDVSLSWNKTPPGLMQRLHLMVCMLDPAMMKLPTFPGKPPLPGQKAPPKNGKGPFPGQGPPPLGQGPFLGQGPPPLGQGPFPGQGPPLPGQGSFPGGALLNLCSREMHFRFVLNGSQLEIRGVSNKQRKLYSLPLPPKILFAMTINGQPRLMTNKLLWSYFPVCRTQFFKNTFTTLDNRSFQYNMTTGCPHVLARDASKRNFFTVLLKKVSATRFTVTVYVKGGDKKDHSFEIQNSGHVTHVRPKRQLKTSPERKSITVIPRVCTMTRYEGVTTLACEVGLKVTVTSRLVHVTVSPWHYTMMGGLCGYFNAEPSDDFYGPSGSENTADAFGGSWLIPGDNCKDECKIVRRPVIGSLEENGESQTCVSTRLLSRCCSLPLRTTTSSRKTGFHCAKSDTQFAEGVRKNMKEGKYETILKAVKNKKVNMREATELHFDCN